VRNQDSLPVARRSFLSRFGIGITAFGVTLGSRFAEAQSSGGRWQASRHAQTTGSIRCRPASVRVRPTTLAGLVGRCSTRTTTSANQSGYDLGNAELAVVIVMRHNSAPFAYTDAIWAKYGAVLDSAAMSPIRRRNRRRR